jgi:tRNA(Leu) C34 or U34 (ribose-2'-O)-methylase TrmL
MNEKILTAGKLPAVILVNPKHDRNVAAAVRACSCFGVSSLLVTGHRLTGEQSPLGKLRLPRELRMDAYGDVQVTYTDRPFGEFTGTRVVAVEIDPGAQPLTYFTHPEDAVYVFGPEDGSLAPVHKRHCTDFVYIPTKKDADGKPVCVNLSAAVNIILSHRAMQQEALCAR